MARRQSDRFDRGGCRRMGRRRPGARSGRSRARLAKAASISSSVSASTGSELARPMARAAASHVSQRDLASRRHVSGLTQHSDARGPAPARAAAPAACAPARASNELIPSHVAARPCQARDQACSTGSLPTRRRSESSRSPPWPPAPHALPPADDHRHRAARPARPPAPAADHIGPPPSGIRSRHYGPRRSQFRSSPCANARHEHADSRRRAAAEKPDHRHRRLLRARRERPRRRRAAEQRDELAPLHSITSSARASSVGGHVEPERLGGLEVDDELELGRLPAPAGRPASRP